nr:hypothetical protein [Streptomyces clavuligerus]
MSETTFTTLLQVSVGGAELPEPLALLLIEGWVDASLNVPSAFQLTFSDQGRPADDGGFPPRLTIVVRPVGALTRSLDGWPGRAADAWTGEVSPPWRWTRFDLGERGAASGGWPRVSTRRTGSCLRNPSLRVVYGAE